MSFKIISRIDIGLCLFLYFLKNACGSPADFFVANELPEPGFIPNIGNGFVAYDVGCPDNGDETSSAGYLFAAGVYSGVGTVTPSKRALIPQFQAVYATHAQMKNSGLKMVEHSWEAALDIRRGTFTNASSFELKDPESSSNEVVFCNISLTWFVHRKEKGLSVLHIETSTSSSSNETCEFSLSSCNGEGNDEYIKLIAEHTSISNLDRTSCYASPSSRLEEVELTTYAFETTLSETEGSGLSQVLISGSSIPNTLTSASDSSSGCYTAYMNVDSSTWYGKDEFMPQSLASIIPGKYISYAYLYDAHVATWNNLWESGIEISGNDTIASSINASLYYILSAVDGSSHWSVSPGGLAKNSYNGHVFWDCETWMLPALAPLYPEITSAFVDYRIERLEAAKTRATERGFHGAMFPWESATTGSDVTPDPNTEGEYEIHVTADIALAIRLVSQWRGGDLENYVRNATSIHLKSDADNMRLKSEWEVIRSCCEYLSERVFCLQNVNKTCALYTYNDVMPPDEQAGVVNASVYTNAAAVEVLIWASDLLKNSTVGKDITDRSLWSHIAEHMYVPLSSELEENIMIHPEFEGYAGQAINQADVVLLQYPLQYSGVGIHTVVNENNSANRSNIPSMDAISFNDLQYYAERTSVPGETKGFYTGDSSYSIAYLSLYRNGFQPNTHDESNSLIELANEQFEIAFEHIDIAKYYVWKEKIEGGHFNFITGAGGFIQNVIYGYCGISLDFKHKVPGILLDYPILPSNGVKCMKIRRIHFNTAIFSIEVCRNGDIGADDSTNIITLNVHEGVVRVFQLERIENKEMNSVSTENEKLTQLRIIADDVDVEFENGKYKLVVV